MHSKGDLTRDRLYAAMDQSRKLNNPAPCESYPNAWTHDYYKLGEAEDLKLLCQACPVLPECQDYLETRRDKLWGIVAGEDLTDGTRKLGKTTVKQAVAWVATGWTHREVAEAAGVAQSTVTKTLASLAAP